MSIDYNAIHWNANIAILFVLCRLGLLDRRNLPGIAHSFFCNLPATAHFF
ncbi:hypothetical protein IMZ48_02830 [Candidatus Bathyarchaeota archaeon]|nr:hypothetical protein [Candidatus Bathyarchaeota archaeon]